METATPNALPCDPLSPLTPVVWAACDRSITRAPTPDPRGASLRPANDTSPGRMRKAGPGGGVALYVTGAWLVAVVAFDWGRGRLDTRVGVAVCVGGVVCAVSGRGVRFE